MTSNINPLFPEEGIKTKTSNVRANFQAAKNEIEALQAIVDNIVPDVLTDVDVSLTSSGGSIAMRTDINRISETKIGRTVTITGRLKIDTVNSPTGVLVLTGLTHPCAELPKFAERAKFDVVFLDLGSALTGSVVATISAGQTSISIDHGGNGTTPRLGMASKVDAGTELYISGTYIT